MFSFAAIGADVQYVLTGIRSVNYALGGEIMQDAEANPDYVVVRKRELIKHLDNLEHCPPQMQEAIKRLTFVSASGGDEKELRKINKKA